MVKAIFFDIDGTLGEFEKRISMSTRQALSKARQAVSAVYHHCRHYLEIEEEKLLDDLVFDAYVTLNGQYCYEKARADRCCIKNPLPGDQWRQSLWSWKGAVSLSVHGEAHRWYLNYVDERVEQVQQSIGTRIPPLGDIKEGLFSRYLPGHSLPG